MTGAAPTKKKRGMMRPACICMFTLIVVSGCATDEPNIPRAELRKLLADEYGYERLDNDCYVVPPSGEDEGQVICPEVKLPDDDPDSGKQARP